MVLQCIMTMAVLISGGVIAGTEDNAYQIFNEKVSVWQSRDSLLNWNLWMYYNNTPFSDENWYLLGLIEASALVKSFPEGRVCLA